MLIRNDVASIYVKWLGNTVHSSENIFGNHDRFVGRYLETSCEVTGEDGLALLKILV